MTQSTLTAQLDNSGAEPNVSREKGSHFTLHFSCAKSQGTLDVPGMGSQFYGHIISLACKVLVYKMRDLEY